MAAIVNRTPTGRLISLHTELKYLKARYGNGPFELKGLKFDSTAKHNPLMYFPLAKTHPSIGIYDPYLDNPLSPAKFHLTQSIQYDSQKSKSASECLNALEALGWVNRTGNVSKLSRVGMELADVSYESEHFIEIARKSVLGYGVFIGFLYKCLVNQSEQEIVNKGKIEIGYRNTHEMINKDGGQIPLSTGSQKDTIVRTRSTLFAWAVTTGFAFPTELSVPDKLSGWHVEALEEIKKKHWGWNKMRVFIPEDLFKSKHLVDRPLSYRWMTKSTKALRERGQESIRNSSLNEESKVKNRRFALVLALAIAADDNRKIDFSKLIHGLSKRPELFVVQNNDFERVMHIETDIAIVAGIPFSKEGEIFTPLTRLNKQSLTDGAPEEVIEAVRNIYEESKV